MIYKMPIQHQDKSSEKIDEKSQKLHMQIVYHAKIYKMPIHKNKYF